MAAASTNERAESLSLSTYKFLAKRPSHNFDDYRRSQYLAALYNIYDKSIWYSMSSPRLGGGFLEDWARAHEILCNDEHVSLVNGVAAMELGPEDAQRFEREGVFPLLFCPAEIRNMIYDACLQQPIVARQESSRVKIDRLLPYDYRGRKTRLLIDQSDNDQTQGNPICVSLLQTNKQVRDEATSFLYRHTFEFQTNKWVSPFLKVIGPSAKYIIEVHVNRWWLYGNGGPAIQDYLGLGRLEILPRLTTHNICESFWDPILENDDCWTLHNITDLILAYESAAATAQHETTKATLLVLLSRMEDELKEYYELEESEWHTDAVSSSALHEAGSSPLLDI